MAFLDSHACLKSSCKAKKHQQKSWVSKLELHEIQQTETKRPSEQQSSLCHKVPLENGELLHVGPENYDFAIYSNFCFLNNFLLKIQNKVLLVLGRSLRLVVYNFAFNSIFPFLINFDILSPNRIISANQGFRRFSQYLYVLQPPEVEQTIFE